MIGIPAQAGYAFAVSLDQDAATDTAIATGGLDFAFHETPSGDGVSNRHAIGKTRKIMQNGESP